MAGKYEGGISVHVVKRGWNRGKDCTRRRAGTGGSLLCHVLVSLLGSEAQYCLSLQFSCLPTVGAGLYSW